MWRLLAFLTNLIANNNYFEPEVRLIIINNFEYVYIMIVSRSNYNVPDKKLAIT